MEFQILCTIFCAFLFKAILNKWDPNTGGFQQAEFQNGIPFANSIIIAQEVIYLVGEYSLVFACRLLLSQSDLLEIYCGPHH